MRKERLRQVVFVIALVAIPFILYSILEKSKFGSRLSIQGPVTTVNGEKQYHTIADFAFVDQLGDTITEEEVEGKIYIANYFFVACPTICPTMSGNLQKIHQQYQDEDRLVILSHSVDPVRDSVPVLYEYAQRYEADASQWHFLTGNKKDIYLMARNSYLVTALDGDGGPTDFIHSELFVLVDQHRHIRGTYYGTDDDDIEDLKEDLDYLLEEMNEEQELAQHQK